MTLTSEAARSHTMQLRALRRLSETEVAGLGIALESLERAQSDVMTQYNQLRRQAEREDRLRRAHGQVGPGPARIAANAARDLLRTLSVALDETGMTLELGKVERKCG